MTRRKILLDNNFGVATVQLFDRAGKELGGVSLRPDELAAMLEGLRDKTHLVYRRPGTELFLVLNENEHNGRLGQTLRDDGWTVNLGPNLGPNVPPPPADWRAKLS